MKPLEFCMKVNNKIQELLLTEFLDSTAELFFHRHNDPSYEWDNDLDNACTLFDIDFYNSSDGRILPFNKTTNIVIVITNQDLVDEFGFKIIDIFNDKILLCDGINYGIHLRIELNKSTEIDEGFVFQLQTNEAFMPFTVQHLKTIQSMSSWLDDEEQ